MLQQNLNVVNGLVGGCQKVFLVEAISLGLKQSEWISLMLIMI